jgi:hypothetical protein
MQAEPNLCITLQMYRKPKDVTNNSSGKLDTYIFQGHVVLRTNGRVAVSHKNCI